MKTVAFLFGVAIIAAFSCILTTMDTIIEQLEEISETISRKDEKK